MQQTVELTEYQFEAITGRSALPVERSSVAQMPHGSLARMTRTAAGYGSTARVLLRAVSQRTARFLHADPVAVGEEFSLALTRRDGGEIALRCVVTRRDADGSDAGGFVVDARFVRVIADSGFSLPTIDPARAAIDAAEVARIRLAVFG